MDFANAHTKPGNTTASMKLSTSLLLAATTAASFFASTASASVSPIITQWNFNSTTPDSATGSGVTTPSIGSGTATLVGSVTSSFSSGAANGGSSDPAATDNSGWQTTTYAAQGTSNLLRGTQYMVSTVGFKDIALSYDLRHSNTSSRYEQVQYTIDGSSWTSIGSLFDGNAGDTWFKGRFIDLSLLDSVEGNTSFGFRVVAAFDPSTNNYAASSATGTYGTAGTWRFDMVTVSGTPIPEPSTYAAIVGALALSFVVCKRRNRA